MSASSLPVRSNLKPVYFSSIGLLILLIAVSLAGILFPSRIYPEEELLASFYPNDMVNLMLGVPMILIPMILAGRGKLAGLLCYPGALSYITYVYSTYLFGLPFGVLFIPFLLLVAGGIYTLAALLSSLDMEKIHNEFKGKLPVRTTGILLLVIAVLLLLYQLFAIISALIQGTDTGQVMIAQWIVDFVLATPAALIISISMIRRRALGHTLATGLLFVLSALFAGLIPLLIIQGKQTGPPVSAADMLVVSLFSLVCVIPFILFIRGIRKITHSH
jgi:hypothetical protein